MTLEKLTDFLRNEWRSLANEITRPQPTPHGPPDESRLIEAATGGSEARTFLESGVVADFMARSEAQLTHAMLSLPLEDDKGRRNLAVAIQTQRQLWRYLMAKASDAKQAEAELIRLRDGRRDFF